MRKRAAAALMAWILMQATPAAAQDWLRSYGGSGRDSLREIVSVGDGESLPREARRLRTAI